MCSYIFYIRTYCEVHNIISYTQNIMSVNDINSGSITNYITCGSGCNKQKAKIYRLILSLFSHLSMIYVMKEMKDEKKYHGWHSG